MQQLKLARMSTIHLLYGLFVSLVAALPAQAAVLSNIDILPGSLGSYYPRSSHPGEFTVFNNKLYFQANDDINGTELWESDGTAGGTKLVRDINVGSGRSNPSDSMVFNGKLYFQADDGINGYELWESDGTASGTKLLKDIKAGSGRSEPRYLTEFNGKLYFQADDGINGNELWESDGTTSGTKLAVDISADATGSYPGEFTVFNNKLYFRAYDRIRGNELWESDGTAGGTKLVKDIMADTSYPSGSYPSRFTVFNNKLYFQAYGDRISGGELWESDGTAGGTKLAVDINTEFREDYDRSSHLDELTVFNNKLYFSANDGNGSGLWESDGTTGGTKLVKRIVGPYFDSPPYHLTVFNNKLYFRAYGDDIGKELWESDGTTSGTKPVKDLFADIDGSDPRDLTVFNNKLYFGANDGINGNELWVLTPLQVTTQTPANGTTGVAVSTSSLSLTFNEAIAAGTGGITLKKASDNSTVDSIDVATSGMTINGQTATVSLLPNVLAPNTAYYATVPVGAFQSADGEAFAGLTMSTDWTFTTDAAATGTTLSIGKGTLRNLTEVSVDQYPTGRPADMAFTHGLYSYRIVDLSTTTPETVNVTLTFADTIPSGAKLYKVSTSGYTEITGVTISGNTATYSITDNGSLDANPDLGTIDDPVALGTPPTSSGGGGSFGGAELLLAMSVLGAALRRRLAFVGKGE